MRRNAKNDGSAFESLVIMACESYRMKGIASINKTPNPWKVKRSGGEIVSAFPTKEGRLVDFIGIIRGGLAVAFDAKSTLLNSRFDLGHVENHQVEFLLEYEKLGGLSFLLIEFIGRRAVYLVPIKEYAEYWRQAQQGGRKSIPYADFKKWPRVKQGRGVILDYLAAYEEYLKEHLKAE